jgi:hypothetical protein
LLSQFVDRFEVEAEGSATLVRGAGLDHLMASPFNRVRGSASGCPLDGKQSASGAGRRR